MTEQASELGGNNPWFAFEAPVGEADYAISAYLHRSVAGAIALERLPVAMKLPAIGLHHDALLRPKRIDLAAKDRCANLGRREPVLPAKLQDAILKG